MASALRVGNWSLDDVVSFIWGLTTRTYNAFANRWQNIITRNLSVVRKWKKMVWAENSKIKFPLLYLSIMWYAPGAELDRPALVKRSKRDPPRCGARPDIPLVNGFWNECFFSMVFIRINVSNFGMLLTTELMSSSLTWTKRQLASSLGNGWQLLLVTHTCSCQHWNCIFVSKSNNFAKYVLSFSPWFVVESIVCLDLFRAFLQLNHAIHYWLWSLPENADYHFWFFHKRLAHCSPKMVHCHRRENIMWHPVPKYQPLCHCMNATNDRSGSRENIVLNKT